MANSRGVNTGITLVGLYVDPLRTNVHGFRLHYDWFVLVSLIFMLALQLVVILWNAGLQFSFNVVIPIGAWLLILYLGFLLGQIKRNWLIGTRTPLTLSSDAVWEQTNRLGERLFKISGVIAVSGSFFGSCALLFILAPIGLSAVWAVVYSYLVYRRLEGTQQP